MQEPIQMTVILMRAQRGKEKPVVPFVQQDHGTGELFNSSHRPILTAHLDLVQLVL